MNHSFLSRLLKSCVNTFATCFCNLSHCYHFCFSIRNFVFALFLVCLASPQSNWNEIVDSFDEMSLREALLRGIYAYGFEKPSAIQQRAIVPCIKGK